MEKFISPQYLIGYAIIIVIITVSYLLKKKNNGENFNMQNSVLNQFSTNFTELIRKHGADPVIGRDSEVLKLVQTLSRKTKNNALLLGSPGVGKTSVVERLAALIVSGQVPESLRDKEVIALDLSSLIAGTKYRGELEQRLNALQKELLARKKNIILFIDEIQQLSQAKGVEGGLSPSDVLKPELARGNLQVIGATTYTDYEKYILPDKSLDRRFHPIHVHEPSREECLQILRGVREVYEKFHHVKYPDEILENIIDLSKKYIQKRFLPDKAVDVLDEVGVHVRLENMKKEVKEETPVIKESDVKEVIAEWVDKSVDEIK